VREAKGKAVVVDGIRSIMEVEMFKRAGPALLLAIQASRRRRFELLRARGRSDDPLTIESFNSRDERELSIGIGTAIALADEVITNERTTPADLAQRAVDCVERWMMSVGHQSSS
jgi:dephospho-CoA kinase